MDEFQLGTYIKKRREELGISQEEICKGLCAVSSLSRIENNQQDPSRSLTMNLLERLGLSQDKFTALWGQKDIHVGALKREIIRDMIRLRRASKEDRSQITEQILGKLAELETITNPDDRSIRQFLLAHRARLGSYSIDERLSIQLEAIRLTCPKFDPEDFQRGRYNMGECRLINQIANTYSQGGQRKRAIDIYRQLLWNIEKYDKELVEYAGIFCLAAHNYAIDLGKETHYLEAVEIADQGKKTCLNYGEYQFLPGFLAIQAECCYFLGDKIKSRELYLQAYYVYKAFGDEPNREIMQQNLKEYFGIENT